MISSGALQLFMIMLSGVLQSNCLP